MKKRHKKARKAGKRKARAAHSARVVVVNPSNPTKKRTKKRRAHKRKAKRRATKSNPAVRTVHVKHRRRGRRRSRRNPALGTWGSIGTAVAAAAIGTAASYGADQLNVSPGAQMAIAEGAMLVGAIGAHFAELAPARDALIGVAVKDGVDRARFIKLLADKEAAAAKPGTKGADLAGLEGVKVRRAIGMGAARLHGATSIERDRDRMGTGGGGL